MIDHDEILMDESNKKRDKHFGNKNSDNQKLTLSIKDILAIKQE